MKKLVLLLAIHLMMCFTQAFCQRTIRVNMKNVCKLDYTRLDNEGERDVQISTADGEMLGLWNNLITNVGITGSQMQLVKSNGISNFFTCIDNGIAYVVYDPEWVEQYRTLPDYSFKWLFTYSLAHEIGHYMLAHSIGSLATDPTKEISADIFAMKRLCKMGATLDESRQAIELFTSMNFDPRFYPSKAQRLLMAKIANTVECSPLSQQANYTVGDYYKGELTDNVRTGYGEYHWADGTTYIGEWKNGQCSGMGIKYYTTGARYFGQFIDNAETGMGWLAYATQWYGEMYYGNHYNQQRHGKGTYFFANGNKYVGDWNMGVRTGFGTLYYADGYKYVGNFANDNRHGGGTLYGKDGQVVQKGNWVDDKFVP